MGGIRGLNSNGKNKLSEEKEILYGFKYRYIGITNLRHSMEGASNYKNSKSNFFLPPDPLSASI